MLRDISTRLLCVLALAPVGAAWADERQITEQDRQFWSFRRLERPAVPAARTSGWGVNEIDQFILSALEAQGLAPTPEADKRTLIRRLSYDLIGLPPAPGAVEAFLADSAPGAYERLVDELLASPHYGERWGRHWLDVARYADSDGYEFDLERPTAYHYRDFVIAALNDDMPFDQFVRWQIAGDEYAPDDPMALAATGFLTSGPTIDNQQSELNRYDELDDMLSTTGAAILGMTLGCARCHDHKYDPVTMRDYYGMLAAFTTTRRQNVPLTDRAHTAAYREQFRAWETEVKSRKDAFEACKEDLRRPLREAKVRVLPLSEPEQQLLLQTLDPQNAAQQTLLAQFGPQINVSDEEARAGQSPDTLQEWDALAKALAEAEARKPLSPPQALSLTDAQAEPAASFLLARGNPETKQAPVTLGFLSVLPGDAAAQFAPSVYRRPDIPTTFQRSALAEWLVTPNIGAGHLTARVIVNRLWHHHFGRGLVRTPSDFGTQGDRPSHPELLDWLAASLVAEGWRLKPLHKLLVMSAVYRQRAEYQPDKAALDPQNRLWWRREPRRLEAEIVRDAMLEISGCLNEEMFGPGVFPFMHPDAVATGSTAKWPTNASDGPQSWRRSIYTFVRRSARMPMLETFDAPETTLSCGRRLATTTPSQALALLNSSFSAQQAGYLAACALREGANDPTRAVAQVYALALGRAPADDELAQSLDFLQQQTQRHAAAGAQAGFAAFTDFCQVVLNLNEFVYVD